MRQRGRCELCLHFDDSMVPNALSDEGGGICRRLPPASVDDRTGVAMWPGVSIDDRCGMFEADPDRIEADYA